MRQLVAYMRLMWEPTPGLIAAAEKKNAEELAARGATLMVEHFPPQYVAASDSFAHPYWLLESTAWVDGVMEKV
ncbi:MAG: hypothetical protein NUW01_00010 [Gemmatimonadaceae bacterium]|nr:hypothetical protein [Gemmatimonadaceae bacterium]